MSKKASKKLWKQYARLLRFVWLNPSDDEAKRLIHLFERKHGKALEKHWRKWQGMPLPKLEGPWVSSKEAGT